MLLSRVYYVRVLAVMLCTMVEQFTPWLNWVWMDTFQYAILYSTCMLGVWISPLMDVFNETNDQHYSYCLCAAPVSRRSI
jgi:NADH:ubiquinone oxidoreductase subunit 2 (subunit N)